jgi:16S rRNA (uracil1498-N3)-methyltransferase
MMRRRFFVDQFVGGHTVMEGEAAHHLGRVLRAERGQLYELSDGKRICLARVEEVKRDRVEFSLIEELPTPTPTLQPTMLLSVVKFDAFEFALEKATELGVSTIVPLAAARCEKALLAAAPKRAERWKKILLEASQQSRRVRLPALARLTKSDEAFSSHSDDEPLRIILSERASAPLLRTILEKGTDPSRLLVNWKSFDAAQGKPALQNGDVPTESGCMPSALQTQALQEGGQVTAAVLAIGPEGGWTEAEFECARQHGFCEASLGQLILRAETAVIAALAAVNYALSGKER